MACMRLAGPDGGTRGLDGDLFLDLTMGQPRGEQPEDRRHMLQPWISPQPQRPKQPRYPVNRRSLDSTLGFGLAFFLPGHSPVMDGEQSPHGPDIHVGFFGDGLAGDLAAGRREGVKRVGNRRRAFLCT